MALNVDQFGQLPLFMSPSDIKRNFDPNPADVEEYRYNPGFDDDPEGTLWSNKSDEAYNEELTHSVRRQGVKEPVTIDLDAGTLQDGHHRVQAAEDVGSNFVPTEFDGRRSFTPIPKMKK